MIGWNTNTEEYLENTRRCQNAIEKYTGVQTKKLFRPPHGRISRKQIALLRSDYEIVMWTYLTGDFDLALNKEKCLKNAIVKTEASDIVVFHDSLKAFKNLAYLLPEFLKHFSQLGFQFKAI